MKKNIISFLIFVLLSFIVLYFNIPNHNKGRCESKKEFQSLNFEGIIINKFIDSKQHSDPIVEIWDYKKSKNETEITLNLGAENSDIFQKLSIGDTISKFSGSTILGIKRNDSSFRLQADYPCDSADMH
jgi:hypothetical protein